MPDLSTEYLGLSLKNPLVVSASPWCEHIDKIQQMEAAGASAVVLHSLFEEQINLESQELDTHLSHGEHYAEAMSYFPDLRPTKLGPDAYLEHVRKAKAAVDIPIIGSLNGVSAGGWIKYGKLIQDAGADALELNIYYIATNADKSSTDVEDMYVDLVQQMKATLDIPIAVKIGHQFSALANFGKALDKAGADGLVLFNRFYQPDFDLENLEVNHSLTLSSPYEILLRLHWVAILYGHIDADLAVTGGVHNAEGVLKSMMAGANVTMLTSALFLHGIDHMTTILNDLTAWMEEKEYEAIKQMQGSMSYRSVAEPAAYERANYLKVLSSYTLPG